MADFVMLYHRPYLISQDSFEAAQEDLVKWRAWMKEMTDKGQLKSYGQPLDDIGKVVIGKKRTITDGPFAETKDIIGGFSIIVANDLDEAVKIASGCPLLDRDGSIEVRAIRRLDL